VGEGVCFFFLFLLLFYNIGKAAAGEKILSVQAVFGGFSGTKLQNPKFAVNCVLVVL
jgi:hypothetical protein